MSTVISSFMKCVIQLFEGNDVHVHPTLSCLTDLKIDSPQIDVGREVSPGCRSYVLKSYSHSAPGAIEDCPRRSAH